MSHPDPFLPDARPSVTRQSAMVPSVWLLAEPAGVTAALVSQIDAYGYRLRCFSLGEGLPVSLDMPGPDTVIIEALAQGGSIMSWVRAGSALAGSPAVMVIDHGIEPIDRILALEAGADDCVIWPCGPRELVARIRAIARRRRPAQYLDGIAPASWVADVLSFGNWTIDRAQRRLVHSGGPAEILPVAEFAVLDQLLRQPRKIVSREALLDATAPTDVPETRNLRAIDIQVSRLRRRLEIDGDELIRTVRGRGYMLLPPVRPA